MNAYLLHSPYRSEEALLSPRSLKAGSLAIVPKAGLCILLPCSPQWAGKSTWVTRSLHDVAGSLSQPGSRQRESVAGSRNSGHRVQHWNTVSRLYRLAFKTSHLDWKLCMLYCKSQWFKSYLPVRLVGLGSVFGPTPDPFQNSIQSSGKDLPLCQPLLLHLNSAMCIDNSEFSKITNKAKFIMH